MASLREFLVDKVLRPTGRALIAYGLYWVWIPGIRTEEIINSDLFPRAGDR
ncbi:hypothetical protein ABZ208_24260 [Streptomyces sp. NPDC006208]|uniref:hypothetical protein n=1 Tax=unclassified Streptomyces TaxID=2593676 RepID=UPI002E1DB905